MKYKKSKILLSLALFSSLVMPVQANAVDSKFIESSRKKMSDSFNDETVVRVIVQTKETPQIDGGKVNYQTLINQIHEITGEITIKQQFDYLVSGFSFDVKRKYIPAISNLSLVKSIREARKFHPTMVDAVSMTQATQVWNNLEYKGEGMVVSVIDTGIDVDHKDMRLDHPEKAKIKDIKTSSETNFNLKVPYGYNYADGNDNVKDSDLNNKSMHGMHVAGIVAANATDSEVQNKLGIDGVAPEAQLLAMKVFSNSANVGTAYEDAIVKAIEDSVKYGADVINMSLGTDNGFHDDTTPESIAIERARKEGVIVVVSAGNASMSTTSDEFQRIPTNDLELQDSAAVGEPSTASSAISVASANNATETGYFAQLDGEKFLFKVATHKEKWDTNLSYPIVDVGLGEEEDYEVNGSTLDLSGKVAFITRGNIQFSEKYERAIKHNAAGVIVANNVEGEFGMAGVGSFELAGVTVDKTTGEWIKSKITSTSTVKIAFDEKSYIGSNEVSSFTSWGPAHDLSFKPEIMAPGGNIYSTINNNGYEYNSGTSMAAPHISGSIALMKQALKNTSVNFDSFVKKSLMNTAKPLLDVAQNTGLEVSPRRQGAGLAQIENAIKNRVIITDENNESAKALKEIEGVTQFTLTLENIGDKVEEYTIRFGEVLTQETDSTTKQVKNVILNNATIKSDLNRITLQPKSKTNVTITLDTTNAETEKFVEGYIYFDSTTSPDLTFPYLGFNGDWGKERVFDKRKDEGGVYDTLGLVSGSSYLGSSFDMFTFSEKVDQEKVGISPNGDENYDSFTTILGLLRNVMRLEVDVVKEESETADPVVTLTDRKNVRKPLFKAKDPVNFYTGNWDGKVFNQNTGKYEVAQDGQYYVRLKATLPSNKTKYQYEYLPFKIDTTKPTLTILSQEFEADEYVIQFKAEDAGIGIEDDGVGVIVDDGDKEELYPDMNDIYEYRIPKADIDSGSVKSITLGALDKVYNVRTETIVFNENAVLFHNATALVGSKNKYLINDEYQLLGRIGKNVKKLVINGKEATIDVESFDINVLLQEGDNEIHYIAKNENNEIVNEGRITIKKDTTPPKLNITNLDPTQLQKLTSNKLLVEGNVEDENQTPTTLRLGHNKVNVNPDGSFSGEASIDWSRIVNIRAIDEAGNETVIPIRTVFEDQGPFKIYFNASLDMVNFYNATTPYIVDGKLQVKGHLNQKVKALYIANQLVEINEENRFEIEVPVQEVDNHISIKVIGLDNSVIYEEGRVVYYDKTLPNLQVSAGTTIVEDKIYTNDENLVVKGEISDNGQGYRLYLNGSEAAIYEESVSMGEEVSKQKFEKNFTVLDQDQILFEVADSFGNKFDRRYTVVLDKQAPQITVEDKVLYENDTLNVESEADSTLKMSLDGKEFTNTTKLEKGTHLLVVEAKDLAGNVTRVEKEIVVVERFVIKNDVVNVKINEPLDLSKIAIFDNKEQKNVAIKSIELIGIVPTKVGKYELNVKVTLESNEEVVYPITLHILPVVLSYESGNVKVDNVVTEQSLVLKAILLEHYNIDSLKGRDVDVYDIYFEDHNGNRVNNVRGEFVVSVKKQQLKPVKAVYYVNESGNLEIHEFIDNGEFVQFKTNHFSIYAVEYANTVNQTKQDVPTADYSNVFVLSCMISLLGIILLKRKRIH